jgi:hypothetical protein
LDLFGEVLGLGFFPVIHPFFHGDLISRGMHSAAFDESAAQDRNKGNRTLEASDKNERMISATGIGKKNRKWGKICSVPTKRNHVSGSPIGLVSDEFKAS